jgi:uncharacterized protein YhhL (DUF1145 family)
MILYLGSQWNNKNEKIINIKTSSVTIKIIYIFYVRFLCVKCITNKHNSVEEHTTFNLLLFGVLKLNWKQRTVHAHSMNIVCPDSLSTRGQTS